MVYVKGADAVKLMNIVNKQKVARARIQHRPPRVRVDACIACIKTLVEMGHKVYLDFFYIYKKYIISLYRCRIGAEHDIKNLQKMTS